jgi:hypothetical protein
MAKTATRSILFTALFAMAVVASARGCGGVTDERVAARTQASKAACDKSQMCGVIGPGLTYESYQSCVTIVNGMIDETYLPEAQCKDIDQSALSVCLSAINGILCDDILGLYLTIVNTCSKDRLCVGVADAGSD